MPKNLPAHKEIIGWHTNEPADHAQERRYIQIMTYQTWLYFQPPPGLNRFKPAVINKFKPPWLKLVVVIADQTIKSSYILFRQIT